MLSANDIGSLQHLYAYWIKDFQEAAHFTLGQLGPYLWTVKFNRHFTFVFRNLVSASQDGKLIVWDGYTTNKVCPLLYNICLARLASEKF